MRSTIDYGPGHNGFFTSPNGQETYIVYHASTTSTVTCDGNRRTMVQPVYWHSDGKSHCIKRDRSWSLIHTASHIGSPDLGDPRAISDAIPAPQWGISSYFTETPITSYIYRCLQLDIFEYIGNQFYLMWHRDCVHHRKIRLDTFPKVKVSSHKITIT